MFTGHITLNRDLLRSVETFCVFSRVEEHASFTVTAPLKEGCWSPPLGFEDHCKDFV